MRRLAGERALFGCAVMAGAALLWLAPRLPMVDLPQHAAQVALWRDLLLGRSPWADLVSVNLLTPYLIGYGLMLPLAFVVPLAVAAKLVLTAAFLGYVAGAVALRRFFGSDPRLDWMSLPGFFGFAWHWGFLTFLAAAPLGLFALLAAARHAEMPTRRRATQLLGLGLLCLFAHALVFLAVGALGGLLAVRGILLDRGRGVDLVGILARLWPYGGLALALVVLRLATRGEAGAFQADALVYGLPAWARVPAMLGYVTDTLGAGVPMPRPELVAGLLAPPLLLRLPLNRRGGATLFGGLVVLLLALPTYAFETAGLVERFALFLPPLAAVLFGPAPAGRGPDRRAATTAIVAVATALLLGRTGLRIAAFGAEARGFETVMAAAEPGRRALVLIPDRGSPGAADPQAYLHYPAWYEADRQGFVDFNFAAFPPQVVRFRADRRPAVPVNIGWRPEALDWSRLDLSAYAYVFVRGDAAAIRAGSPCRLDVLAQDGSWQLLGLDGCRTGPARPGAAPPGGAPAAATPSGAGVSSGG